MCSVTAIHLQAPRKLLSLAWKQLNWMISNSDFNIFWKDLDQNFGVISFSKSFRHYQQIINCIYLKCAIWWHLTYNHTHENIITIKIMSTSATLKTFMWAYLYFATLPSNHWPGFATVGKFAFAEVLYNWINRKHIL